MADRYNVGPKAELCFSSHPQVLYNLVRSVIRRSWSGEAISVPGREVVQTGRFMLGYRRLDNESHLWALEKGQPRASIAARQNGTVVEVGGGGEWLRSLVEFHGHRDELFGQLRQPPAVEFDPDAIRDNVEAALGAGWIDGDTLAKALFSLALRLGTGCEANSSRRFKRDRLDVEAKWHEDRVELSVRQSGSYVYVAALRRVGDDVDVHAECDGSSAWLTPIFTDLICSVGKLYLVSLLPRPKLLAAA